MLTFDVLCADGAMRSFKATGLEHLYATVKAATGAWPVVIRSCH